MVSRQTEARRRQCWKFISKKLDCGQVVGCYSLDLSAAFDLLNPKIFLETVRDCLPQNIITPLMEFLSGRCFQVEIDGIRSSTKMLKVFRAQFWAQDSSQYTWENCRNSSHPQTSNWQHMQMIHMSVWLVHPPVPSKRSLRTLWKNMMTFYCQWEWKPM